MSEHKFHLKAWELALLCALCLTLCAAVWAREQSDRISSSLIRLHVLAVDDSAEEQALKLRVRDAVLAYLAPKLERAGSISDAQKLLYRERENILRAAQTETDRAVTVTFTREHYPTRDYGSFALPAGTYPSLRVIVGAGEGHNWWCVVFPPLCTAESLEPQAVETMTKDDARLITSDETDVVIKFRILEWYDAIKEALT